MILHFSFGISHRNWENVARFSGLEDFNWPLARLDYRESNNSQVVQSWYLNKRNLEPRMIACFKIKLL